MDWEKLATTFGLPGFMIVVLGYVAITLGKMWIPSNERIQMERTKVEDKKAEAMASALTSLGGKVDAHHTADIQSHQQLATGLARVESKLDTIHELTPVNQPCPATPPRGVPAGEYGFTRPKTQGGGR